MVIVVAVVILAMIAMANLLTATVVGLRDHVHEAGILKAMGLTPRQVIAIARGQHDHRDRDRGGRRDAAGPGVAPRLINTQGQASGMGWGIASGCRSWRSPDRGLALAVAAAAALFLARRAARNPDSAYLRGPARPQRKSPASAGEAVP